MTLTDIAVAAAVASTTYVATEVLLTAIYHHRKDR